MQGTLSTLQHQSGKHDKAGLYLRRRRRHDDPRAATRPSSAARAPTLPKWPASACRCRRASPSPPRNASLSAEGGDFSDDACAPKWPRRSTHIERAVGKKLRRCRRSAAGLGPLRRAGVDAGHDGHGAQPRPQRRDGGGLAGAAGDARFAWDSYRRFIQMYSDVVLGLDHGLFEEALEIAKEDKGFYADTEMDRRRLAGAGRRIQGHRRGANWAALPAGRARTAVGRDPRRVRQLGFSDRAKVYRRLNDIPGDWGTAVNVRPWCSATWAIPGHRRRLHPRSGDRREGLLRRMAGQRPGRGRGRRHPHAAIPDQAARETAGAKPLSMEEAMPEAYAELAACSTCSNALPRHAGHRVHGGTRQAVDAADPQRQAHRQGRAQDGGRHGGRRPDRRGDRDPRVDPMALDQLLHPTLDPNAPRDVLATGLPASPGAASGQAIVLDADTAEKSGPDGRGGDPGARRDQPGGHPRHARGQGHPDRARRHDQPRRRGGARHGPPLRLGRRRVSIDMASRTLRIGGRELKEGDASPSTAPPAR
jgi:pyruvate, orthophosphate dikinase